MHLWHTFKGWVIEVNGMPVPIVFNDPTVQGVSNYFQIVPFAKSQWSGLSGNLRNFKYIYCILCIHILFAHFGSFFSLFDILSLAKSTARATINRCQQPSLCWQVEWLQRRLLHQWLGLQQQLWIKVGPTRLENGTENGTENGGDILRPFDSRTFTMRMAGLWI